MDTKQKTGALGAAVANGDNIAGVFRYIAIEADKTVGENFMRHYARMEDPEAMAELRKDIDFQSALVTPDEIVRRVGLLKNYFEKNLLPHIVDAASLYDACVAFADVQANTLFFINNDLVSTRIAGDYLKSFVSAARSALSARGMLSPQDAHKLDDALAYSALGITSYEALRTHILPESLVGMGYERTGQLPEKLDGTPVLSAVPTVARKARELYADVLKQFRMDTDADSALPMLFASVHDAYNAGALQAQHEMAPGTYNKRTMTKDATALALTHIAKAVEGSEHLDDHAQYQLSLYRLLHGQLSVSETLSSPVAKVFGEVHTLAALKGKAASRASEHPVAVAKAHEPNSQWLNNASTLQKIPRADAIWEESMQRIRDMAVEAKHFKDIAHMLDGAVDALADNILTAGHPVRLLDGMRAYVATVRKEVGSELFGTPEYSEEAVRLLSRIEQKCALGIESYYAAKPLIMDHTDRAYDDMYMAAVGHRAGFMGTPIEKLGPDELKEAGKYAETLHKDIVRTHEICAPVFVNPYIYALQARCQHLAHMRDAHNPASDHAPLRIDDMARVMLTELLNSMPRKEDRRGRIQKSIWIDSDPLFAALNRMEKEARALERKPQGLRH